MIEKLYRIAPLFIKTILLNIKSYLNVKERFTKDYYTYLEEYKTLWLADLETIQKYQEDKLRALLLESYQYAPFYKNRFLNLGISEKEIEKDPFGVLKKLPLLSKEDRKSKVEEIVNTNPDRKTTSIGHTSGTSGSPTINYLDAESTARAFALWSRFHHFINIKWKDKSVRFSGRLIVKPNRKKKPFWIYSSVEKQLFMSAYHLSDKNLPIYIEKLNKFQPEFIDGYPSAIYILAKYINAHKILLSFKAKAISTTAETLYDYQRVEIEKAFNTKVYNQYASSEGSPFITECINGSLHINLDSGVFEFLNNEDEACKPGEIGRMVVTSFRNDKTPLIRYDILDTVLLPKGEKTCNCGCKMPLVEKIIGREDDVLWTEEKGYVGRMDTAYKGVVGIVQSQIIQKTKTDFIVNQIVDADYTETINSLFIKNLKDRLGENINITINIVDDIPLGANGKFDAVKREFQIP